MAFATTPADGKGAFRQLSRTPHDNSDRAREFRRAERHSTRVRILKIVLPLIAAAIMSLYALPSLFRVSIDKGRGTASVRAVTLEAGSLKMLEPRVKGVNEKNDAYDFTADSATQASRAADEMYLENIHGRMLAHDGKITTLTAPNGIHNNKADIMIFNNGAFVKREPDMTATFQTATVYMKEQRLVSKTPVVVRLHESTIHAETMTLLWGEQQAAFEGNVRTHIEREASQAAQPVSSAGGVPVTAATLGHGADASSGPPQSRAQPFSAGSSWSAVPVPAR